MISSRLTSDKTLVSVGMDGFPAQVKNIGGSILCDFDA
jgi:hypothetical protein